VVVVGFVAVGVALADTFSAGAEVLPCKLRVHVRLLTLLDNLFFEGDDRNVESVYTIVDKCYTCRSFNFKFPLPILLFNIYTTNTVVEN